MLHKRYTLQEIASMAGVSITTASMVMNGKARQNHISAGTEQKILDIIRKAHFTPNLAALAISGGRTNLVGFVMRDEIDKSFWAEILAGLNDVLEKSGLHLILSFASRETRKEFKSLDFLRSKRVEAYILVPGIEMLTNPDAVRKLYEYDKESPVILMTGALAGMNSVSVSEKKGGALAARHLLELGHRRLAVIGNSDQSPIHTRLVHFSEVCRKAGAKVESFMDVDSFMPNAARFTGAFCFSDTLAIQLCNQCTLMGLHIPQDLSIVGYDNQPISELSLPKLTTIHQPKRLFGQKIGHLLLRCISEPGHQPEEIQLAPRLIVRDSTMRV